MAINTSIPVNKSNYGHGHPGDIPLLQLQLIMQEAQLHSYLFYMTKVCTLPDMDLIFLKSFIISATLELSMVLPAYLAQWFLRS